MENFIFVQWLMWKYGTSIIVNAFFKFEFAKNDVNSKVIVWWHDVTYFFQNTTSMYNIKWYVIWNASFYGCKGYKDSHNCPRL